MDPAAIAETTVEMWCLIDAKLIARKQTMLDPQVQATLLKEAMALYMTHIINKAQSGESSGQLEERAHQASDKQVKYIADLGGDPNFAGSAAEASKEIERLKSK